MDGKLERDVKLGRSGIRDIGSSSMQTLQLIHGAQNRFTGTGMLRRFPRSAGTGLLPREDVPGVG